MIHIRLTYVLFTSAFISAFAARASDAAAQMQDLPHAIENPAGATHLDQLGATRDRPLFAPDRRRPALAPVISVAAPPPPPPIEPPKLSLSGIIVDAEGPRAVIRSEPAGKTMQVRLGDEVGGWRVTEIEQQRLVISLDDRSVAVKLFAGDHGGTQMVMAHQSDRVLEVNAAGVLRSHRVPRVHR